MMLHVDGAVDFISWGGARALVDHTCEEGVRKIRGCLMSAGCRLMCCQAKTHER